jgi:hypothetical protein
MTGRLTARTVRDSNISRSLDPMGFPVLSAASPRGFWKSYSGPTTSDPRVDIESKKLAPGEERLIRWLPSIEVNRGLQDNGVVDVLHVSAGRAGQV